MTKAGLRKWAGFYAENASELAEFLTSAEPWHPCQIRMSEVKAAMDVDTRLALAYDRLAAGGCDCDISDCYLDCCKG